MKKVLILVCLVLTLPFLATQGVAKPVKPIPDQMVMDSDTDSLSDINSLYWKGSDTNPSGKGQLNNGDAAEEAWLEALLGYSYDNSNIFYVGRVEAGSGIGSNVKQLIEYDPGVDWDYAVVKYGKYWIAYEDTYNNNLLTTDKLSPRIDHVTFFDPPTPSPVPEPATMLLLGLGLVGLAGARRKVKK